MFVAGGYDRNSIENIRGTRISSWWQHPASFGNVFENTEGSCDNHEQVQAAEHPLPSEGKTSPFAPTAVSSEYLHRLLGLNEPSRSMKWARLAYSNAEDHAVPQLSLCQHYKRTFEKYDSLVSPLILLKAVMYEFPSVAMKKEFNGLKYVVKGIRLRESQAHLSSITEQEQAEVTTFPRLQEVPFDTGALLPDVMEGTETPIWKIMGDSQEALPSHSPEGNAVYEDGTLLKLSIPEPLPPTSTNSTGQTQDVEATSPSSSHEMHLAESQNKQNLRRSGSNTRHLLVIEHTSEPHQVLSLLSSGSERVSNDLQPQSSTASTDVTLVNFEEASVITSGDEGHSECCNVARTESFVTEDECSEQLRQSRAKRTRHGSLHSPVPRKSTKIDDEQSLATVNTDGDNVIQQDLELDEDTIVVECRPITQINSQINAVAQSGSRGKEFSLLTDDPIDPSASSTARKHQEPSPLTDSPARTGKSRFPKQYSGESPRVLFSSTTEIDSKKNTMAFLRDCGGKSVKRITSANILCVGSNQLLKKSANLVLAICMGLDIVTDKWLVESQRKGFLLDADYYLPKDAQREGEWGFKLCEAINRGKQRGGMTGLLGGIDVYFTHGLKSLLAHNFRDFTAVATCLGADTVKNGLPNGKERKEVLILGTADDPQTLQASRTGHEVWSKDLLVMGALRGTIQRIDAFNIAKPMKQESDISEEEL